jgi:hypothetical protein
VGRLAEWNTQASRRGDQGDKQEKEMARRLNVGLICSLSPSLSPEIYTLTTMNLSFSGNIGILR